MISDPANAADARTAGCEFTPYRRAPHRHDKSAASTIVDDYKAANSSNALYTVFYKMAAGPSLAYAQDVLEELENYPADVVVASELLFGGQFAAEKAGLPGVMVIPGSYSLYAPHMPIPGMLPQAGLLGWMQAKLHAAVFRRLFTHPLPALRKARAELGLPDSGDIPEYQNRLPAVLVLTSPAFEFAPRFPPNVLFTGPMLDDPPLVGPSKSPWPASDQRPLVIVSFGTTYQRQEDLIKKSIQAIADLPYRGLVTVGPAINIDQFYIPPNVHIEQFMSHAQVLPHASAVVTHAGHGTVIRALAHGVPLVCIPIGRDQPANAARVVAQGAGLRLPAKSNGSAIRRATRLAGLNNKRPAAFPMASLTALQALRD